MRFNFFKDYVSAIFKDIVVHSHETLHEAKQLLFVYHAIAIFIDLVKEGIAYSLIKRLFVANLGKSCLCQRYNLDSVQGTRIIFVILEPESINDHVPLRAIWCIICSWGISDLSGS